MLPYNSHTVSAMTANHRAVTQQSGLEGTLIPETVERNIHASQKEEHRNILPFLLKQTNKQTNKGRGKLLVKGLQVLYSEEALFCKGNLFHLMWI